MLFGSICSIPVTSPVVPSVDSPVPVVPISVTSPVVVPVDPDVPISVVPVVLAYLIGSVPFN